MVKKKLLLFVFKVVQIFKILVRFFFQHRSPLPLTTISVKRKFGFKDFSLQKMIVLPHDVSHCFRHVKQVNLESVDELVFSRYQFLLFFSHNITLLEKGRN
jgi:hypothetical protein